MKQGGFTIVEVLVIVIVIGILASITTVAYNGVQNNARAATIAENVKKIKDAFLLYGTEKQISTWPIESTFGLGENPAINNIASSTEIGNYLKPLEPIDGFPSSSYIYDNDGDIETFTENCTSVTLNGINIRITNMNQTIAKALDDTVDDGDLSCGAVRWYPGGNMIKYILSETQALD